MDQVWTYLEMGLVMFNTPLPSMFGYSPSQVTGGTFWLTMVPVSWWFVGRRTRRVDRQGVPAALRLSVLGLRLLASAICLILALDILEIVTASTARTSWDDLWQFKVAGDNFKVSTIAVMGAVILGAYWGSGWLIRLITQALEDRDINAGGTIGVLLNLGRYILIVVGVAVALDTAGVNLTALFTASAALFVGLGFALQNIAQNFISGLILLIEGAIQPGDILEVEGRVVKVVKMSIRSTVVRSLDDEDLIVPNTALAQGTVKNLTMMNDSVRVRASISVAYDSDLDRVIEVLTAAALHVDGRDKHQPPMVLLQEFAESGVHFEVMVWIVDPWHSPTARSSLRLAIWRALRHEQIRIPFPQVDVHFDAGSAAPVATA